MASIGIENGKRIDELMEISLISSEDSYLPISINALTRKISIVNLRNAFNGDDATSNLNNLYFTAEKVSMLFSNVYDEISKNSALLDNMEKRIAAIYNEIGSGLSDFKKEVQNQYAAINLALQNVRNDMSAMEARLNNNINTLGTNLTNLINSVNSSLGNRITAVENKLANITGIMIGTNVPSSLPSGTIYLQYF